MHTQMMTCVKGGTQTHVFAAKAVEIGTSGSKSNNVSASMISFDCIVLT
jgi:hypothetical protein